MQNIDILIKNCTILTMKQKEPIRDGIIAIKNGKITFVGKGRKKDNFKAEREIDAKFKVALPGLINCHTHVAMTIFRGIAEDKELNSWLKETIWPLEAKLKPEDVYHGTLLGCLEMIKTGTTCFVDMYFYEDAVAKAVEELGLRAVLAPGILSTGLSTSGQQMLENAIEIYRKFHGTASGRLNVWFGPHAVYSCDRQTLISVMEAAKKLNTGLHIHLAESAEMAEKIRLELGISEVGLLHEIGFLAKNVLAAHCIHLSKNDIELLARHNVKIAYNPVANMKLAQGTAKIKEMLDFGITVGLGTDGPASNNSLDMFETMKIAALLQKLAYKDPGVLPAWQVLKMATVDAAKALGLESEIGSIEAGKKADIILLDFKKPHLTPIHDLYANIVYSARGSDVDTVIVDGKVLMENREVIVANEEEIIRKAEKTALDIVNR